MVRRNVRPTRYWHLGRLQVDSSPLKDLPVTNNGESRIKHCVKYELGGGYRLVTVQTDKVVAFCFAGTHDDTDRWLDSHGGLTLGKGQDGAWEPVYKSPSIDDPIRRAPVAASTPLLERMENHRVDRLLEGVPATVVRKLATFELVATPEQLESACRGIESIDRRVLVYDVLCLLASGNRQAAESRLDLELGVVTEIDDLSGTELLAVLDGDQMRTLRVGSPDHEKWLQSFARNAGEMDWLLFLHPEQAAVVNADFNGPAQLSGVSGSGKTCVAIHRAVRLATARGDAQVLVVTLNRSLAGLIQRLVDAAAPDESVRCRIKVSSFFQLCQELLAEFEPHNTRHYADVSWKLNEHIDEVFREYYRCWLNNDSANVLWPVHDSLVAQGICAETYVREEFDWIRSALVDGERSRYLSLERLGRRIGLLEDARKRLLAGLSAWEAKMWDIGVTDYEFNMVVILNCSQGVLPPDGTAKEEEFRHGCKLYVAMTRARDELYLSYSGEPSQWLDIDSKSLTFMEWTGVVALRQNLVTVPPASLSQLQGDSTAGVLQLKGREFLYVPDARGLSLDAIRKIDDLVDGIGLIRKRQRVRWRNMMTLHEDLETKPSTRLLFGPVIGVEVQERLQAITRATSAGKPR
ncbi:ATP-dependent DNA helicase Rep [Luteitalea pratensis]|uniref:DNA 3'-5' helicase n=1 Tax=Luteitalea pratensis TaxID=1855912 RepID=A0A143PGP4_LUTPR|nr:ATP-dependent DNA helicase Rep [Luteitalea pratensis]